MNTQIQLLPHKHVKFSESLIGIAGFLRSEVLSQPRTIDEILSIFESKASNHPGKPTFTQVVLAIDVLFAIGEIELAEEGRIVRKANEAS